MDVQRHKSDSRRNEQHGGNKLKRHFGRQYRRGTAPKQSVISAPGRPKPRHRPSLRRDSCAWLSPPVSRDAFDRQPGSQVYPSSHPPFYEHKNITTQARGKRREECDRATAVWRSWQAVRLPVMRSRPFYIWPPHHDSLNANVSLC